MSWLRAATLTVGEGRDNKGQHYLLATYAEACWDDMACLLCNCRPWDLARRGPKQ